MVYISCLLALGLCCLFDPIYNNYTSLLNSSYSLLYFIWIFILDISIVKTIIKYSINKKQKIYIYFLGLLFIIGSYLPYYSTFYLFSFLHVTLAMLAIVFFILYIFYIILNFHKKEPLQAQSLYQWYFWGLSVIALFIIFFGHINGIIEITTLFFIFFMLKKLKIIDYS